MSKIVYRKSRALTAAPLTYCPGCTHGIIHKLVAEALEEFGIERAIGVASVGCSVFSYNFFNCDMQQAAHGRACAVATGIKRVRPEAIVFTYQGDGDLASIGIAETIHAANRGENITVVFVNNAIYGMTGGQMAPTTLIGQKTTTSPFGRNEIDHGLPIKIAEIFAQIPKAAYIARVSVYNPPTVRTAKAAVKKALTYQTEKKGFTLIEFLSSCPINWGMTPIAALKWIEEKMTEYYPLGVFKDIGDYHD
ncbi:MAG: thiamine pyrophosphate-dependent enzyme [Bacilli bacterium]|nr:thiamine pyrophosphate-dependent enzyme [Bacilli bacterium]MDD4077647.1 thiamine pyrophosphate-dependent enzyme [Bacilli bacterium]MDD4388144.1 thiamine pyrophosphate-dependent enzyme [Bacilli bacterium]